MLSTREELAAHDVAGYLPYLALRRPVPVFVDVPGDDLHSEEAAQASPLVRLLAARGGPLDVRAEPHQRHTWTMARAALPYALVFAAQHLA